MRNSYQYRERDYAFGNLCLTLRTRIGVTQGEFADLLGVSERAIQSWEVGESYPKVERLKRLIAVCVQHHVFEPSHPEEEIWALWQAAHQRVLLDETWLRALLAPATGAHEAAGAAREVTAETLIALGATAHRLGRRTRCERLPGPRGGTGRALPMDPSGALPTHHHPGHGWHR